MKIYYLLFYKIYSHIILVNKKNDIPVFSALIALVALVGLNIITIFIIIKLNYPDINLEFSKRSGFTLAITLITLNWLVIFRNNKYKEIISEYSKREKPSTDSFWVICYVILTIYLFFISPTY